MAEQLDFLLDSLYPQHKVIVWAHNMHVSNAPAADDFPSMGELLAQRRRAEMYTVGFYMGHGMANNGAPGPSPVYAPPPDTVEGVLANGGVKYAFVDFSKAAPGPSTTWFTAQNTVREFGVWPKKIVPARSFDAIFYIDTVTPSEKY
jgi:erythromycin esterase